MLIPPVFLDICNCSVPSQSILPASFKRVQLREMHWVTIAEEDAVSEMWLVWSKHREQSHAAQRFKQQLMSASAGRHFHAKEGKNVR